MVKFLKNGWKSFIRKESKALFYLSTVPLVNQGASWGGGGGGSFFLIAFAFVSPKVFVVDGGGCNVMEEEEQQPLEIWSSTAFKCVRKGLIKPVASLSFSLPLATRSSHLEKKIPTQHHIHDHPNSNGLTYSQKTRYNDNNTKKEINNPQKQDQTFQRINLFTNAFPLCGCVHRIRQLKNKNEEKGRHLTWFWLEWGGRWHNQEEHQTSFWHLVSFHKLPWLFTNTTMTTMQCAP